MRKIVNKPQAKPLVFYGLLLIPTVFLCCAEGFGKNTSFFIVVLAMLLTSIIEIPIQYPSQRNCMRTLKSAIRRT
jgi:uncharacterized membrane protein